MNVKKITWQNFITVNEPNPQQAFEKMCRVLFAKMLQTEPRNINSSPNNPGVEVNPIRNSKGEFVSFQAKFFLASVDYSQIENSMQTAINNYNGNLDIVYLYCNKDFTQDTKGYRRIVEMLCLAGISVIPVTNEQILQDIIENCYSTIGNLYFDSVALNRPWFDDQL